MPRYLVERTFPDGLAIPMTDAGTKACQGVIATKAKIVHGVLHVGCGVGQHRLDGAEELDREAGQRSLPLRKDRRRGGREVAAEHHRAPHAIARQSRCARNRFGDHPFERAVTNLSQRQSDEKALLLFRRASEQLREQPAARLS